MMMHRVILIFVLLGLSLTAVMAQVYTRRMDEAVSAGDTALQRKILREWQFEWPDDADLQVAYTAFYNRKYQLEPDSAIRNSYLVRSASRSEAAVRTFPDRLDIRFGYISLLGEMAQFDVFTTAILAVLDHHDDIGDDWLWRHNNKIEGTTDFLLQYIDLYNVLLYNQKDPNLYPYMDSIANRILQSYPEHIPALLSLGMNAIQLRDDVSAKTYLIRAHELEPSNTSVLDNLAHVYGRTGERDKEIYCYQQILLHGTDREKEYANDKLAELVN